MGFSTIWFGGVIAFIPISILGAIGGAFPVPVVLVPLGMLVFGDVLMRTLVFSLVDEVSISGDELMVRKGKLVDYIAIRDLKYAQASVSTRPEQVLVVLNRPCHFGDRFSFAPDPRRSVYFGAHPIGQELCQMAWDLNHPLENSEHVTEKSPH